jgi:hypothetical protein
MIIAVCCILLTLVEFALSVGKRIIQRRPKHRLTKNKRQHPLQTHAIIKAEKETMLGVLKGTLTVSCPAGPPSRPNTKLSFLKCNELNMPCALTMLKPHAVQTTELLLDRMAV